MEETQPSVFRSAWWQGQALQWAMRDDAFKVKLFRFVDVFPSLHNSRETARHVKEYFEYPDANLPTALRWGLKAAEPGHPTTRLASKVIAHNIHAMAKRFIAGTDAQQALSTLRSLRAQGIAFTLDVLGEATLNEAEAETYQARYEDLLTSLPRETLNWDENKPIDQAPWGTLPRVNVSLKITSLQPQLDPVDFVAAKHAICERLRPLLRLAQEREAFLNIDLEQYRYHDLTLDVFRDLLLEDEFKDYPHFGIVIQAYLRDSEPDLLNVIELARARGTPVTVRLVKGAYWDYETALAGQEHWPLPVFTRKSDTDAQYEYLTRLMLENWEHARPALGTHNIRSIAHAVAIAQSLRIPEGVLEIQMLHGMAEPIKRAVREMGIRLREYVPVGELVPGMAYLVRRLLENTANESFLRQTFVEAGDRERLLARPLPSTDVQAACESAPPTRPTDPKDPGPYKNEPHADFARKEKRAALASALKQAEVGLGKHHPLMIGGKEVDTTEVITSTNPSHPKQTLGTVGSAGHKEAEHAVTVAQQAFPKWRDTPVRERAAILFRAGDLMRRERFRLAALEVLEAGKPWREADGDVTEAIDFLEYYGREMLRIGSPQSLHDIPGELDFLLYEPRGVAVVIAPWNFPLAILTGMTSAALVTGNTVIMKPAQPTPLVAYELYRVLLEAGLPPQVLSFLPGPGQTVGAGLVEHPNVDLIAFTGSKETGLSLLETAGKIRTGQKNIKRVVAEMGGKNALIIDEDADLDAAVEGTVRSAFGYSGQKCSACSRAVVLDSIYDQFVRRLVGAAHSLRIGDPTNPWNNMGPVISEEAMTKIQGYIDTARSEADEAAAISGPEDGYFIGPHIYADVPPQARIAQEEIFGPVLSVIRANSFDEALEIANGTVYGLTGGLYSRSPSRIERAYREFRVGNLYINREITGSMVGRQPFGGSRMSGVGSKAGGPDYLLQFLEPRCITENTLRRGFAPPVVSPPLLK